MDTNAEISGAFTSGLASAAHGPGIFGRCLDGWAPLVLHQQDLVGAESQRNGLTALITDTILDPTIDAIRDGRLLWLVRSLASETWAYLGSLGHESGALDAHITKVRSLITGPGEKAPIEVHPDADLCAVYYVDAPTMSGSLCMIKSTLATYAEYVPAAGRLMLFPARQRYEMLENCSESAQIALVFELTVTDRSDGPTATTTSRRTLPRARAQRGWQSTTDRLIPARVVLDQPGPPADLVQPLENLRTTAAHLTCLPPHSAAWELFRRSVRCVADAIDMAGMAGSRAAVSQPSIACRTPQQRSPFATGPTDVQAYVRLDDADDTCVIEYENGDPLTALECGSVIVVDSRRRHRVLGRGVVMRFGVALGPAHEAPDIDSLARLDLRHWTTRS